MSSSQLLYYLAINLQQDLTLMMTGTSAKNLMELCQIQPYTDVLQQSL